MAIQSDQEFAPTQIARAVFPTAFRGYDQDAVRRYLSRLASALEHQQEYAGLGELEARTPAHERVEELETEAEDLRQEIRDLELELVQRSVAGDEDSSSNEAVADAVPFDEHRAIELLGKETARVLESARSAAADILKRAETQAASLKSQAKSELAEARRRADSILSEKQAETEELAARLTTEAEAEAERISTEAQEHRDAVVEESAKILSETEARSEADQAEAEERAKQIVADAEALRQQVVSELVAERREAQDDMERIKAARDRLAMSLAVARTELDEVADALVDASVGHDDRSRTVPVPVGGRSHREEVAGLIEQLEAFEEVEADPDPDGDGVTILAREGSPATDDRSTADEESTPANGKKTTGTKGRAANDQATDFATVQEAAPEGPTSQEAVVEGTAAREAATENRAAREAAAENRAAAKAEAKDATENTTIPEVAAKEAAAHDRAADATTATDRRAAEESGAKTTSPKAATAKTARGKSQTTKNAGRKKAAGPAADPAEDDGDDNTGESGGDEVAGTGAATRATDGVRASVKQKKNGRSKKAKGRSTRSGATEAAGESSAKKAGGDQSQDDDLVSVIDAALSDGGDATGGQDDVDEVNVIGVAGLDGAELNKLPADGEELSLVEGFTTIDVGDIDLRDKPEADSDRGGSKHGESDADGPGDVDPDLVHSVVVNEPQIPEDVITTVASRTTATNAAERTQGDLLVEQPFTGRLPKEFSARDLALTRSGPNFRRQLRRALNDDQSDVLDRLRAGRSEITAEELPGFADQIDRYHAPLRRGLAEIAQAGAKAGGQADLSNAALDNLVRQLARYIVDRVRVPTIEIVESDTDQDRERILEPIRALYRDFRNVGLADLSEDALYEAFAIGLYDSIEPSAPVSWVLDPRSDPDPVCDINSRRKDVVKGVVFPSGHARPLSLPGCRCLVTVADY